VVQVPPGQSRTSTATCPADTVVTGGGMRIGTQVPGPIISNLIDTGLKVGNGWQVQYFNANPVLTAEIGAVATCAELVPP
jgi:hypothetical protein